MSEIIIKYLDLEGLSTYDTKIKEKIATDDATVLSDAKAYADGLADNYDPAGTAQTKVSALETGKVKANTDAIAKLNGADTVVGSVAEQIKNATTALKEEISASSYDDTAIKSRVTTVESAIETLNGTGTGSVDKKVSDAVAALVADAPAAYDTLKEISDWISSHATDASAMNSQIVTNKNDISNLKTLVGALPEGATSTTIISYIAEAIGVAQTELTSDISTAKAEAISDASSDATTKANTAEQNAKDYADSLADNYATASQGKKADTALQKENIATGTANGTISVGGTNVPVKGLGSSAYKIVGSASGNVPVNGSALGNTENVPVVTNANGQLIPHADGALKSAAFADTTAFEPAGTVSILANGAVKTNTSNIENLAARVNSLETNITTISEEEITALFS